MKFTINSGQLTEHIGAAISSLPAKPTAAIMGGVLIEAQDDTVTLSSFNYDRATARRAAADIADTDTLVVSGRLLATVGGNLPKNTDTTVASTGTELLITAGRTEFRLPLLHTVDYPHLPVIDSDAVLGAVDCAALCEAVTVIGGLASKDAQPANLTALNLTVTPEHVVLCATDRYVIGRRRLPWSGVGEHTVINVVASDLLATIKAVGGADEVDVLWNGSLLGLRTPTTTVVTRTLDEEFPDAERIMQVDAFHAAATVPTGDLASMLRRAASVADDEHAQIDITIEDSVLSVTTSKSATGNIADSITAAHYGGDRRVTLSARRLNNLLAVIDDRDVTLAFREHGPLISLFPGSIEPRGGALRPPDTDTVAALMGIGRPGGN